MLNREQTRAAIEKVLHQVQAASGRECPEITDATKPIGDLDAFDSLTAVEATVLLELELNCTLAEGIPFISASEDNRPLAVAEVVERVGEMMISTRAL